MINVILRIAFCGAYVDINSISIGVDLVYAWPNAELAVCGTEGAANIIYNKEITESEKPEETRNKKIEEYKERFANPYIAAGLGMIDDVIDPRETRLKIHQGLQMLANKSETRPKKKHGNMPL